MEGVSTFYVLFYQFPIALSKTLITLQLLYELFIMSSIKGSLNQSISVFFFFLLFDVIHVYNRKYPRLFR